MAPKPIPQAERLSTILKFLHDSNAAFNSKDIKQAIITLFKGQLNLRIEQAEEFLTALVDEGQVRMEKIGSGNWYWSFVSDAKKSKERVLSDLEVEEQKLMKSVDEIESQIDFEMKARENKGDEGEAGAGDRQTLLLVHERLLDDTATLEKELAKYSDSDPTELLKKAEETKKLRETAEKWTDYVETAEGYFKKGAGMSKREVAGIMEGICGDEYVSGGGLKDLEKI